MYLIRIVLFLVIFLLPIIFLSPLISPSSWARLAQRWSTSLCWGTPSLWCQSLLGQFIQVNLFTRRKIATVFTPETALESETFYLRIEVIHFWECILLHTKNSWPTAESNPGPLKQIFTKWTIFLSASRPRLLLCLLDQHCSDNGPLQKYHFLSFFFFLSFLLFQLCFPLCLYLFHTGLFSYSVILPHFSR